MGLLLLHNPFLENNSFVTCSSTQGAGVMPDGTTRFRAKDGRELFHFMGCSTFAEYAVVADISVAKVPKEAAEKLETLALLGCGVSTGYGAALNTAKACFLLVILTLNWSHHVSNL